MRFRHNVRRKSRHEPESALSFPRSGKSRGNRVAKMQSDTPARCCARSVRRSGRRAFTIVLLRGINQTE